MLKKKSVFYIFFLFFLVLAQVTNGAPVPVEQQPPTCNLPAPNNFHTTSIGSTSVSLAWDAVTGASGYSLYLYQNGNLIAPVALVNSTSYTFTGLNPGTDYTAEIHARCSPLPTDESPNKATKDFTTIVIEIICQVNGCQQSDYIGSGSRVDYTWKLSNQETYVLVVNGDGYTLKYTFEKTNSLGHFHLMPQPGNAEIYKLGASPTRFCPDYSGTSTTFYIAVPDGNGYSVKVSGKFFDNYAEFAAAQNYAVTVYKGSCSSKPNPNAPDSNDHFSEEGTELALTPLPNPFSDRITIKGSAGTAEEPVQIALFNSEGVLVKQEEAVIEGDHTLATDDLPPGLYFLQLKTAQGSSAHKLIKL